jgi:hypothetical protein
LSRIPLLEPSRADDLAARESIRFNGLR